MSNESTALALSPRNFREARELAEYCAQASIIPPELRKRPADLLCIIATGQELGLAPMAAIRGIHMIKGKPELSSDAIVAVVLASGKAEHFTCVERTDDRATFETKRQGAPNPVRVSFSMADARRAKLLGRGDSNWDKYPAAMLCHRAKAHLARLVYPDVVLGLYSEDEIPRDDSGDYIDAEILEPPPPPAPPVEIDPTLIEQMDGAADMAELDELAREIAEWSEGPRKKEAREAYRRNRERLTRAGKGAANRLDRELRAPVKADGVTGEQIRAAIEAISASDEGAMGAIHDVAGKLAHYQGKDRLPLLELWRAKKQDIQEGS